TNVPGTTRDPVRASIALKGVPLNFVDTAGIRETKDIVEQAGIKKTKDIIGRSALVLVLLESLDEADDYLKQNILQDESNVIWLLNKIDLNNEPPKVADYAGKALVAISAKCGTGLDLLEEQILQSFGLNHLEANEQLFSSRQRHLEALKQIEHHLNAALDQLDQPELVAEELTLAQKEMSGITGEFSTEDLLGEIFSRFCIGK
ncbi:50S ribosome-binding GTPase, partial [Methylophilaceae bacterium]|nr:50S ribosome-binding GTPase [Methylophilaceae bacterium]